MFIFLFCPYLFIFSFVLIFFFFILISSLIPIFCPSSTSSSSSLTRNFYFFLSRSQSITSFHKHLFLFPLMVKPFIHHKQQSPPQESQESKPTSTDSINPQASKPISIDPRTLIQHHQHQSTNPQATNTNTNLSLLVCLCGSVCVSMLIYLCGCVYV